MKAEYHQPGDTLNYINPTGDFVSAETLVIFGSICGITATDIAPGQLGTLATKGVYKMPKDAAAITGGAKVYYDEANDVVTATASTTQKAEAEGESDTTINNVFVGIAVEDADASAVTVLVRLNG